MRSAALCLGLLALLAVPPAARAAEADGGLSSVADGVNTATVTGQSPWLVIAGRGAYRYFTTPAEQRDRLGLSSHPAVFGTLAFLLLLVACKDTFLTWLGPVKVPLDVLAELFHATGGLAGYAFLADLAFGSAVAPVRPAADLAPEAPQYAASLEYAASLGTWLMLCVIHTAVWIVFNSIEVAIILSPFPLVDTLLKSFRTALVGLITAAAAIHPALGFLLALPIVLLCVALLPFALRLGRVGWVFCLDFLGRWLGFFRSDPLPPRVVAFASWGMAAPLLKYGEIVRTPDGGLAFTFRRLGFLWRCTVPLPADAYLAVGTLTPLLLADPPGGSPRQLLMFPPRYDGREPALAERLGITRVGDVSLRAGLRAVLRRLWGRLFAPTPA